MGGGFHNTFIRLRSEPSGEWVVHPDLRGRLVQDAVDADANLTEVVVGILAERYGGSYEVKGRKTAPTADADELHIRIPFDLYQKISAAALETRARRGIERRFSAADQIREDLCAHYGLKMPQPVAA